MVSALATGHRALGHRVAVAAVLDRPEANGQHAFLDGLARRDVDIHQIVVGARRYREEHAAIVHLCARLRPDVVHTHGNRADVVGGSAARRARMATVSTVHGYTGGGWRNAVYEWMQRRSIRHADAVVAVSRPLVGLLTGAGVPAGRVHLIPNAFSPAAPVVSRIEARRALGMPEQGFFVGWIGRLSAEKGPDVLVDALALTPADIGAVFIGTGKEGAALRARAMRIGVEPRVRWAGPVPSAAARLTAFDVVVLSSRTEGTPIVLLEAMSAGVPVIVTPVGGVPDVVSAAEALMVPPDRPDLLAEAIVAVRDDPAGAAERARAARQRLEVAFAPAPWLDAYAALYDRVAGDA